MKRILHLLLLLCLALPMQAQVERPKLLVGIMVDQMRWDYLYVYNADWQAGGLRRLVDEGFSFENTLINYVPTVTAVGHASVYTGSVPALNGIVGNNFYQDGRERYCCDDDTVRGVGADDAGARMSPRNLLATGIGDELKLATQFRSRTVGVALKDRAAILPAGHSADAAFWWDQEAGHFVSSTWYMQELPQWVKDVNRRVGEKPGTNVKQSVPGVTKTFDMAIAALQNMKLGLGPATDMLAVSVSSTDAIGHEYGTRGKENHDVYMELDRQIARLLQALDQQVGRGNYLLFLTADHGAAHNPNYLKAHHIPAGGTAMWNTLKPIEQRLEQELGCGRVILGENAGRIYLDHEALAKAGVDIAKARQALISELLKDERILYAVDYDHVAEATIPQPLREMIINGYNRRRSGDVYYAPRAEYENVGTDPAYRGTTHAMWNPYDAHIPFLVYGWHVPHAQTNEPVHIVDIAPTICAMLHIQMPDCAVGQARTDLIKAAADD